jgi:hypothetical protein
MRSLGKVEVTVPGTPVVLTEETISGAAFLIIQARPSNAGILYVGRENLDRATSEDVLYELTPGQVEQVPLIEQQHSTQPGDYYLDAEDENVGDAGLVSYA